MKKNSRWGIYIIIYLILSLFLAFKITDADIMNQTLVMVLGFMIMIILVVYGKFLKK